MKILTEFTKIRTEITTKGIKKTFKDNKKSFFWTVIITYLIRDLFLYVFIPYLIAGG